MFCLCCFRSGGCFSIVFGCLVLYFGFVLLECGYIWLCLGVVCVLGGGNTSGLFGLGLGGKRVRGGVRWTESRGGGGGGGEVWGL